MYRLCKKNPAVDKTDGAFYNVKKRKKGANAMKICIFGASSDTLAREYYEAAFRLGELMAQGGHTLVYGGGNDGLMRACADGVKSGGGTAIGVAPRMFDEGDFLRRDFGELIFTETMAERKTLMRSLSQAFVVLPGGTGTLDEFFETLTLKQLGEQPKPIVLLNTMGYYDALCALLRNMIERGFVGRSAGEMIALCAEPEEALERALIPDGSGARSRADYNK